MHILRKISLGLIKMKNITLFITALLFIIVCTHVMYQLEPDTFGSRFNALYFTLTTFATVGYGDFSPQTVAGKNFTMFMYLFGIGLLGVVIGKIVDSFNVLRRKREEGKMKFTQGNHVIIVGWSKKAEFAIQEILDSDPVTGIVVVDQLSKSPVDLALDRIHYVQGDPTEEETFDQANISQAKAVIVFADDHIQDLSLRDAKSLLIATTVERLAPAVHTTVEIMTEKHKSNFTHVKVDEFILAQETISHLAVRSALYRGITQIYSQLISRQQGEDLYKISKKEHWYTYRDAFEDLLNQGATLIADRERMNINRHLQDQIPDDAILYVICNKETYQKLR